MMEMMLLGMAMVTVYSDDDRDDRGDDDDDDILVYFHTFHFPQRTLS